MRNICIFNQKGGVGKTTTAINLAAGISRYGKKVLLIDLDPQGNIDTSLKISAEYDLYDALTGKIPIKQCIVNRAKNLDIITSKESLVKAEAFMQQQPKAKTLLKDLLSELNGYDFLIIDCPPSLSILNENALAFCNEAFVPASTDYLGYDALSKMQNIIKRINESYKHNLKITKIIPTMFDKRNKICKEMLATMQNEFPQQTSYPIHMNSKLKEAPKFGKSIFSYDATCTGAKDYGKLVEDVLAKV